MGRWLINFGTAHIGGTNAIQLMQQPGKLNSGTNVDYGFGLGLDNYRSLKNVYHTGSWAGDCAMTWFPEKRFGVAVFANAPNTILSGSHTKSQTSISTNRTIQDTTKIAGGSPATKPSGPVLTPEMLTHLWGDYWERGAASGVSRRDTERQVDAWASAFRAGASCFRQVLTASRPSPDPGFLLHDD